MEKLRIAIMEGDDIGTEIVPVARDILSKSLQMMDIDIELIALPIGKLAHEKYGDTFPHQTISQLNNVNGIICGPI